MNTNLDLHAEWLETDGQGGFASGTVAGVRTRRYQALLLAACRPPAERFVLVNGLDAWVETTAGVFPLSTQHYTPDVIHPRGSDGLESFTIDPWPTWVFRLADGTRVRQEIFMTKDAPRTIVRWRLLDEQAGVRLAVRPFFSGRDYHALQRENGAFRFSPERMADGWLWRPYDGVPGTLMQTNGEYQHEPTWFRNFLYAEEQARGLDCVEDLASPGTFRWNLSQGDAVCLLQAVVGEREPAPLAGPVVDAVVDAVNVLAQSERARRAAFSSPLDRAADAYLVRRGAGKTIIAGYPWFTDWGRDTFIALRGLCLATGRLDDAQAILLDWAGAVSQGMLPNRFPDQGETPEFNSVDASLWYVVAVHEFLAASRAAGRALSRDVTERLDLAIDQILAGYARGTRYGIRLDDDGLLAAGEPGVQLTWMDAKVGDWVVTPRIGKPVEVQALWLNALWIGGQRDPQWQPHFERGRAEFAARFWNAAEGALFDVVDADHVSGQCDPTFRPNQIFAVGGLPLALLEGPRARQVVDAVERRLATPLGLRSLAPGSTGFAPHYAGDVWQRDGAYHQGTVWPWLLGPFVEAWVRVRGATPAAKAEARRRFVAPLREHLLTAGLGHVSEIADAEPPHTPRGCPFQAWSLAELLRLEHLVLAESLPAAADSSPKRRNTRPIASTPAP